MDIGARIRNARLRSGMTQTQLARSIETSDRNIQRWEAGDNAPRAEQIRRIAVATGTTVDALLSESDAEAALPIRITDPGASLLETLMGDIAAKFGMKLVPAEVGA